MDGNLAMQNNITNEEPASYLERVYGFSEKESAILEGEYMKLCIAGGGISIDEFVRAVRMTRSPHEISVLLIQHVSKCGLLFNEFERRLIREYNGVWGFEMPKYANSLIIKYNLLKLKKEIAVRLGLKKVADWLSHFC